MGFFRMNRHTSMNRMLRAPCLRLCSLCLTSALATASAYAQSDAAVLESATSNSAEVCPGYSVERARPGLRAIPVGALRVLAAQRIVLCPDRRLESDYPVVWYGGARVYTWNPEAAGAVELLTRQVDGMTRKQDFPVETLVWAKDGSAASGVTVPAFEPRPRGLR